MMDYSTKLDQIKAKASVLSVLVVEDDRQLMREYKEFFSKIFTTTDYAESAEGALSLYESSHFDIIYTDITLMGKSGIELIKEIQKKNPSQEFIIVSAHGEMDFLKQIVELNVGYIQKPLIIENFASVTYGTVSKVLGVRALQAKNRRNEDKIKDLTPKAVMGEMLEMIAHQWKQPLSIMTASGINLMMDIEMGTYDNLPEKKQRIRLLQYIDGIKIQVEHLASTINKFSGMFRGDCPPSKFNIKDFIERTVAKSGIEAYKIETKYDLSLIDDNATCNKDGLEQVILTLITNAIHAMSESNNKTITIRAKDNEKMLVIAISDTGTGIDENIKHTLFDAYFSTKSKNGNGLGLYLAKNIIEDKMQGRLSICESNVGACFKIVLPKGK